MGDDYQRKSTPAGDSPRVNSQSPSTGRNAAVNGSASNSTAGGVYPQNPSNAPAMGAPSGGVSRRPIRRTGTPANNSVNGGAKSTGGAPSGSGKAGAAKQQPVNAAGNGNPSCGKNYAVSPDVAPAAPSSNGPRTPSRRRRAGANNASSVNSARNANTGSGVYSGGTGGKRIAGDDAAAGAKTGGASGNAPVSAAPKSASAPAPAAPSPAPQPPAGDGLDVAAAGDDSANDSAASDAAQQSLEQSPDGNDSSGKTLDGDDAGYGYKYDDSSLDDGRYKPNRPVSDRKQTNDTDGSVASKLRSALAGDGKAGNGLAYKASAAFGKMTHGASKLAKSAMRTVKRFARRVKNMVMITIHVVTNPAFWVTILVILGLMLGLTTVQTFGPQYVDCTSLSSDGNFKSTSSGDGSSDSSNETALKLAKALAAEGFSKASTAGVLGNVQAESSFNASATNGTYVGLVQTKPENYTKWFAENGISSSTWDNEDGQIRYIAEYVANTSSTFMNRATNVDYVARAKSEGANVIDDDLYTTWLNTDDPKTAAIAWMEGYERAQDDTYDDRANYAQDWYDNGLNDIAFTGKKTTQSTKMTTAATINCVDSVTSQNNADGSVSGTYECDQGNCDFSWMCDSAGVCKNGDGLSSSGSSSGRILINSVGNYQCVWYAWARLSLLHPNWKEGAWDIIYGNGNAIGQKAQNMSGWETTRTDPKPGDGVSFQDENHVAVVEKVEGDKVYISEGNYNCSPLGSGCWNGYNTRWIDKTYLNPIYFRSTSW